MSLVVVLGLVGGGAFAYFSDTETSTGNTFSAGTLDLTYNITYTYSGAGTVIVTPLGAGVESNGVNSQVIFANVAPGDSGEIVWTFTNAGSLPGRLDVRYQGVNDYDFVNTEPELNVEPGALPGTPGELNDNMTLSTSYWLNGIQQSYTWSGLMSICTPTWTHADSFPKPIPAHGVYEMRWVWTIPSTVGNIIQGDTFTLNLDMSLTSQP